MALMMAGESSLVEEHNQEYDEEEDGDNEEDYNVSDDSESVLTKFPLVRDQGKNNNEKSTGSLLDSTLTIHGKPGKIAGSKAGAKSKPKTPSKKVGAGVTKKTPKGKAAVMTKASPPTKKAALRKAFTARQLQNRVKKMLATKATTPSSAITGPASQLPIAVQWSGFPTPGSTATNAGGSTYLLPQGTKNLDGKTRAVQYDSGRKAGLFAQTTSLTQNSQSIGGVILSHMDEDHISGFDGIIREDSNILQYMEFLLIPVTPADSVKTALSLVNQANAHFVAKKFNKCLLPVMSVASGVAKHYVADGNLSNAANWATNDEVAKYIAANTGALYPQKNHGAGSGLGGAKSMLLFTTAATVGACTDYSALYHTVSNSNGKTLNDNQGSLLVGYKAAVSAGPYYYLFTGDSDAADIIAESASLLSIVSGATRNTWDMMEIPHHGSGLSAVVGKTFLNPTAVVTDIATNLLAISKGYFVSSAGSEKHADTNVLNALYLKAKYAYFDALQTSATQVPMTWVAFPSASVASINPALLSWDELIKLPSMQLAFDVKTLFRHLLPTANAAVLHGQYKSAYTGDVNMLKECNHVVSLHVDALTAKKAQDNCVSIFA